MGVEGITAAAESTAATEGTVANEQDTITQGTQQNASEESNSTAYQELVSQLSEARAEAAKWKNANDKSSQEAASYKKQLRAKMTAEEQDAEAKAEAERLKDERIQEMATQLRIMDYSKRYMGVGMDEKTAEVFAGLTGELEDVEKFFSNLDKFVQTKIKSAEEDSIQKFLKSRPDIKAGTGTTENSLALEKARELAKKNSGVNENILKFYKR